MVRPRTGYVMARDRANLSAGEVVRMTCELNEISQAELSKRSGISPSNVSDIIHGRRAVGRAVAEKLARALNVSPAFILFSDEKPRQGSDTLVSPTGRGRHNLLLRALRTLKKNENKRAEMQLAAMKKAINFITQVLRSQPPQALSSVDIIAHAPKDARMKAHQRQHR